MPTAVRRTSQVDHSSGHLLWGSRTWRMITVFGLLLAMTGMAAVGTGQQNLLVNPGGEEGQTGWQVPDGQDSWASLNASVQDPHEGSGY